MSQQDFERHIRRELSDHHSSLDAEKLWQQIRPEVVEEKPKRRALLWWWLGIELLAVLLLMLWIFWPDNAPQKNALAKQEIIQTIESDEGTTNPINQNDIENQNQEGTGVDASTIEKKQNNLSDQEASAVNKNIIKNTLINLTGKRRSATSRAAQEPNSTNTHLKANNTASANSAMRANNTINQAGFTKPVESVSTLAPLAVLLPTPLENKPSLSIGPAVPPAPEENTKALQRSGLSRLTWAVGAEAGLTHAARELTTGTSGDLDHLRLRQNSEKSLETLQLGLNAYAFTRSNVHLRSGLSYSRIASRFSYEKTETSTESKEGVIRIIINAEGDTIRRDSGLIAAMTTTTFQKKTYNYLHLLDVPLVVGYTFGTGSLSFSVEGGVYINISLRSKGEVFNEDQEFVDLKEETVYRANLGASLYGGFSMNYNTDYNWQFYLRPSFRYFPGDFSRKDYRLEEAYSLLGVQAGVIYKFE